MDKAKKYTHIFKDKIPQVYINTFKFRTTEAFTQPLCHICITFFHTETPGLQEHEGIKLEYPIPTLVLANIHFRTI